MNSPHARPNPAAHAHRPTPAELRAMLARSASLELAQVIAAARAGTLSGRIIA